jgi:CheY-like chemotaxis protein
LKQGDFDVAKAPDAPLKEYFALLSEIINRAPRVIDSLNKLAVFDDSEKALKDLADMQTLLAMAGCDKLAAPVSEISCSDKDSDMAHAVPQVMAVLNEFCRIFTRLLTARLADGEPSVYGGTPLQNAYKQALDEVSKEESSRKLKILAVDDMLFMLSTVSQILSDEYKVYELTDPMMLEAALQFVTPELFLLDYDMPQRNGFDLMPIIRGYPEHKETPIIFLTATGTNTSVLKALKLGACDYLVKPIKAKLLRQKVAAHIVRKNRFNIAS